MPFTALHRALGIEPGPMTDELLDSAVAEGVTETDELDWKSELPPMKGLSQTDFPKDIAAMANGAGGVIVYGVRETQKAATGRVDVGKFDEVHERALRSAAITAISPPVFGLKVHRLGAGGSRAIVVEVPSSVDGPHLIYRNDYFGAPIRNDADTVWMKERQIEAMYRARFDERRHATEALDALFTEALAGRDAERRAWLVAVGHPRVARIGDRLTRDEARAVLETSKTLALRYAGRGGIHPLENVDVLNPRPGLRRWVAVNTATSEQQMWREAWVSIHHDGSVSLAAAVGGHRSSSDGYFEGWQIESAAIECAVADFMALVRATAEATDRDEYDLRVGIDWAGDQPLSILTKDNHGFTYDSASTPLHRYSPVETSASAIGSDADFHEQVEDLARDCINQGGVSNLRIIRTPQPDHQS
ncbi:MAG: ATP-binding protein [Actinobacteria bacterium]|nr:ATP-binding protein [Actinomycetota bacterium]